MYRYCVLLWNRADSRAAAAARFAAGCLQRSSIGWELALDADGIVAFHSGADDGSCETRLLTGEPGAILGRVFRTGRELESTMTAARAVGREESARIVASGGAHLIDRYWGRYVAVGRDEARDEAFVLRDPSGGLPCYITSWRDVTVVFSDVEGCLALDLFTFSVNWKYVAAFVPYSALQIRDTGLNEVTELQAGERFTINGHRIGRQLIWNPIAVARREPIEDPATAVEAVRRTVETCVHAWTSVHRSVIHNLSGGLDSSIVLSCLKTAPTPLAVTCLHHYSPSTQEDERKYARLMAGHAQVELVEAELDGAHTRLDRLASIRRTPKPWFYIYDLLHSPVEARVAAERGATGIFSGAGGDSLFVQARADLAVADHLRCHGFTPGVLSVALDAARVTRTSLWPILRKGVARHLRRAESSPVGELADARSLIPQAVLQAARDDDTLIHPWIQACRDISPGLLWQVLCLSVPPTFYECFGGETDIERTAVLVSQPLIELCVRIPSYVWISGGRDRAIARRAFADALPPLIARRQQKGGIDRYNLSLFDANETYLREMLLDGLLVREGLLDRERLERFLARDTSRASFEYNDVLRHHLCTEVWLRRWSQTARRAAA
jgi:asparagine synthase (glutamine-hydrolysing)